VVLVTLAGAIEAELPSLRAEAESLMLDTGQAKRPTGGLAYDPGTQTEGPSYTNLDSGPCKLQSSGLSAAVEEVGDRTATLVRYELHRPVSSTPLAVGDIWEFTSVDDLSSAVVGERFRVVAPFEKTLATARRYQVERVVS
jgi:hypothetical protein